MTIARAVGGVLVALAASACAGLGPYPSEQVTTTDPSWVAWFRLDWAIASEASGTRRLSGYVHNSYGQEAGEVQLLTQAFDASGKLIDQRISRTGSIPPLSRTWFEVRKLPAAPEYRVSIWTFSFNQAQGWF